MATDVNDNLSSADSIPETRPEDSIRTFLPDREFVSFGSTAPESYEPSVALPTSRRAVVVRVDISHEQRRKRNLVANRGPLEISTSTSSSSVSE